MDLENHRGHNILTIEAILIKLKTFVHHFKGKILTKALHPVIYFNSSISLYRLRKVSMWPQRL